MIASLLIALKIKRRDQSLVFESLSKNYLTRPLSDGWMTLGCGA